jgi:ABC-2 type transporter
MSAQAADARAASPESQLRLLPVRAARLRDGTVAMGWAELRKLRHDHLDIFTRSVQPLLWVFVFGTALQHNHTLSGGSGDYRAYLAPGVMAQAALFVAIFFGLGVIWERDVGQLQRLLATPLPRLGNRARQGHGRGGARLGAGDRAAERDRGCGDRHPVERSARGGPGRAAPARDRRVRMPLDDPRRARADT